MRDHLFISIRMTIVLLVITCGVYPLAVWAIGQAVFHDKANGSLIVRNGRVIGSELIGQSFASDRFFHPRPSASDYDPTNSGGTNLGPTSKKLRDAIAKATAGRRDVPADAVTSSASGLDPHISPANAASQSARVARANGLTQSQVDAMIRKRTEGRFLGIYGGPRVNVLLLNLDIMQRHAEAHRRSTPRS
jgi:K+-transporting ATPase ATPase C chain